MVLLSQRATFGKRGICSARVAIANSVMKPRGRLCLLPRELLDGATGKRSRAKGFPRGARRSGPRCAGRLPGDCPFCQALATGCGASAWPATMVQNTDGDRYSQVAHMSVLVCAGLSALVWVSPCLSVSVCLRLSTSASVCLLIVSACLGLSLSAPVHLCEYVCLFLSLSLSVCLCLLATVSLPIYHG